MRTISIYLTLLVLFLGNFILSFAQNNDNSNGTFYQAGGKIFEVIDKSENFYQFNLSFDKTKELYRLKIIIPKPIPLADSIFSFVTLDKSTINMAIKKLISTIPDKTAGELADQILNNQHKYEINKITSTYEEQISKEKRSIGKLGFRKSLSELNVPVYCYAKDIPKSSSKYISTPYPIAGYFKVENALIAFGDGVISKINVNGSFYKYEKKDSSNQLSVGKLQQNTKKRAATFYNFLPPIPIRTREHIDYFNISDGNERYWLTSQWQDIDDTTHKYIYFIYLSDVLFYEQNIIFNYGVYLPPNGKVIELKSSAEVFELQKESFINDFDLRLYTDLTGLSADNPNGLLKFMGKYNIKLKSPPFNVRPKEVEPEYQTNFFEYANIFFNFNKLENDKLIPPIRINEKHLYSTSFDLYRYSKFELGVDLNFLKVQGDFYYISLDFLGGFYHTPIDSVFINKSDTVSIKDGVNSFYTGLQLNVDLQANEYVDFNLGYSFIIPQLFSNNKLQEIYKPINDIKFSENTRGVYLSANSWIHNIYAEFSIYPDPQDKSSFLFLKSGILFNSSDNFITLQLGYSIPFSNIISIGQSVK